MRTVQLVVSAAVAVLLAGGCGQGAPSALGVREALAAGGDAVVEGYVFADDAGLRLCEAVAESFPPRCGGASLLLTGVSTRDFPGLRNEDSRFWSDRIRRVRGEVAGDALAVTDPDV